MAEAEISQVGYSARIFAHSGFTLNPSIVFIKSVLKNPDDSSDGRSEKI